MDNLHIMRKIEDYPNDGGYSGALILEKNEKGDHHGNENDQYIGVYEDSLRDMPHAFKGIR